VLLIEDDIATRASLTRGPRDRGHAVLSAPAALDGLRLAVEERPDLIVLDLGLPDLDGLDLLRMLRAVSRIPVIVVTARDGDAEIAKLLDAGADEEVPFGVRPAPAPGGALLTVGDAGPGFGTADPLGRGESGAGSTGLGLDIARRSAESSGGALTLGVSPAGGASVTLFLAGSGPLAGS
jgi:CheY-like chemotaxis protein